MNTRRLKVLITIFATTVVISVFVNWIPYKKFVKIQSQAIEVERSNQKLSKNLNTDEKYQAIKSFSSIKKQTILLEVESLVQPAEKPSPPVFTPKSAESADQNEIYHMLSQAIGSDFPELNLSENEVIELSELVPIIRDSLKNLRELDRNSENIEEFRRLENQRDQAILDFERITGMTFLDFMLQAPANGGIDHD
jgi:hypothetical protein